MAFAPRRRPQTASSKNRKEVDHTFTDYVRPILENSTLRHSKSAGAEVDEDPYRLTGEGTSSSRGSNSQGRSNRPPTRCGDRRSYHLNNNNHYYVDRLCATRMYRVLTVKPNHGEGGGSNKILFDPIDGRLYNASVGFQNRISHNVVCYDNKKAAMSERYPTNQVGAARGGNGKLPRILVAFGKYKSIDIFTIRHTHI